MAVQRDNPYGSFNFQVDLGTGNAATLVGGFQEVTGLNIEVTSAEYRNGNEKENHVRKIPGIHKVADVTLKRGVIKSDDFFEWINQVRENGVVGQKQVEITLLDEARNPVQRWVLRGCIPLKYTAPTLAAKGGGDAAIEELVLSAEGMYLNP